MKNVSMNECDIKVQIVSYEIYVFVILHHL